MGYLEYSGRYRGYGRGYRVGREYYSDIPDAYPYSTGLIDIMYPYLYPSPLHIVPILRGIPFHTL